VKVVLAISSWTVGLFVAWYVAKAVRMVLKRSSFLVGGSPFLVAISIYVFGGGGVGYFPEMDFQEAIVTAFVMGMVSAGAYIFWSGDTWGE